MPIPGVPGRVFLLAGAGQLLPPKPVARSLLPVRTSPWSVDLAPSAPQPRNCTTSSASRMLSASASARKSPPFHAASWREPHAAAPHRFLCAHASIRSWHTVRSNPNRASSLCICSWRCFAENRFRSASRCCAVNSSFACSFALQLCDDRFQFSLNCLRAVFQICDISASMARNSRFIPSGPASSGFPPVTMRP